MKSEASIRETIKTMKNRVVKLEHAYDRENQPPRDDAHLIFLDRQIAHTQGWVEALEEVLKP